MLPGSKTLQSDPHSIPLLSSPHNDEENQTSDHELYNGTPRSPPKRSFLNRYSWVVAGVFFILFVGLLAVPKPSRRDSDRDGDDDDDSPVPGVEGICVQRPSSKVVDDDMSKALEGL